MTRAWLASVFFAVACGGSTSDLSSSVQQCELAGFAEVCSASAQAITAADTELSATAIEAGVTYAIAEPGGGKRGYVAFTAATSGTHTLFFGDAEPIRVCEETALCSSALTNCGELHRAAQYALVAGEIYIIELRPGNHPFRLHIAEPTIEPPPPPGGLKLAAPVFYPTTGTYAGHLSIGDLDADGALDLAVSNPDDASGSLWVDILRNSGTGAFSHAARVTTSAPNQTAIADFDGDGDADIVGVASDGMGPLPNFFLLNDGDFAFTKTTWTPAEQYKGPMWTGDFDEDGIPDLVIPFTPEGAVQESGFVILRMPDLAVLQQQADFDLFARDAIAGDFNGDGHQDVIVASSRSTAVHLWLGNGTGTVAFDREVALPLTAGVYDLIPLDLDGNATTDFIAFGHSSQGGAVVLGAASDFAIQALPSAAKGAVAGDFDHDGRIDLIAGALGLGIGGAVEFYRGTEDGFVLSEPISGVTPSCTFWMRGCMVAGDVNNDGLLDLVTNGEGGPNMGGIAVLLGTP